MKKPLAALFAATVIVTAAACSGGGGGGGGSERPSAGVGHGRLRVIAYAEALCLNETEAIAHCQTLMDVMVADSNDNPVNDATVTFGPPANLVVMTNGGTTGTYATSQTNLSDSYHLSVVRGSDSLTGAVLVRPHDYRPALAPDPPAANAPSKLTWSPSGSSASSLVYILEFSPNPGQTYADSGIHGDDGKRDFTASAFPEAGTYQIQIGLATLQTLASSPGSAGEVILARVKNVTIP